MVKKNKKNILQAFLGFIILIGAVLGLTAFILHFTDKKNCSEGYETKDPGGFCANCNPGLGSVVGDASCTYMTDWLSKRGIDCSGPAGSVCTFSGKFIGDLSGNINGNLTGDVEGSLKGNVDGNVNGSVGSIAHEKIQLFESPITLMGTQTGLLQCPYVPGKARYQIIPQNMGQKATNYLNRIIPHSAHPSGPFPTEQICTNLVCSDASDCEAMIGNLPWPITDCSLGAPLPVPPPEHGPAPDVASLGSVYCPYGPLR